MSRKINLKKGLDLRLVGAATSSEPVAVTTRAIAIVPDDFPGFVPKVVANEGDKVLVGSPLFRDKWAEGVMIVSPVAGVVKEIVRGARRKIERVVVEVAEGGAVAAPKSPTTPDEAREFLQVNGLWAMTRQRPYDIVPECDAKVRDVFVTAFDSAPLAPDMALSLKGRERQLAEGVRVLKLITDGSVYVSRRAGEPVPDIEGAEMVDVYGPHPSGNAGVQAANIAPVNKGETIMTLDAITLARVGEVSLNGHADAWGALVAVTGSEVINPRYVSTTVGAEVAPLLEGNVKEDSRHHRVIGGNVLTGKKIALDGYLRYPYTQITVIPEGDDVAEFMGWAAMGPSKQSVSRSYPGHFLNRLLNPDARLMGGRRAMIMSGEYDKVIPMDIMAEYLIKAILAKDIDRMEALGIYEVAPEDFAMAEYVDTSKLPLQQIVREGLDYLRKELK